jgi:hypothetical protein
MSGPRESHRGIIGGQKPAIDISQSTPCGFDDFRDSVPKARPVRNEKLPKPGEVAEAVRRNVSAVQVKPGDKKLLSAYARVTAEVLEDDYGRLGLTPPSYTEDVGWIRDILHCPDNRMFLLRYSGPDADFQSERGVVELRQGNFLGMHFQRTTRLLSDEFFQDLLQAKRSGVTPDFLYSTRLHRRRGNLSDVLSRGCMSTNDAYDSGLFDLFNFSDMSGLDEAAIGLTHAPNAVFLRNINILPEVAGMGLSEVFLKQALAHDLDGEHVNYVFAYGRIEGLHRRFADNTHWNSFDRYYLLMPGGRLDEMPLPEQEYVKKTVMSRKIEELNQDVSETRPDGKSVFRTIRFHQNAGAEVICAIPFCSVDDAPSLMAGVLLVYDLNKLRRENRI